MLASNVDDEQLHTLLFSFLDRLGDLEDATRVTLASNPVERRVIAAQAGA
jgi:hypothetical protein